jgi:hypothetical protein
MSLKVAGLIKRLGAGQFYVVIGDFSTNEASPRAKSSPAK